MLLIVTLIDVQWQSGSFYEEIYAIVVADNYSEMDGGLLFYNFQV